MAINEIEMNTSTLGRDIETLEDAVGRMEQCANEMFANIQDLSRMWSGNAHTAFQQQFQMDYESCQELHRVLGELVDSLQHAREEYDKCEQNVDNLIRSIQI